MGQQQLLLLVLSIVIAGIAVVAGIVAFKERSHIAHRDEAVAEAMRIVNAVQAWKLTPAAIGGSEGFEIDDFSGVSLKAVGFPVGSAETTTPYITVRGCYKLAPTAEGAEVDIFLGNVGADCDADAHIAKIRVTGPSTHDIIWIH